MRGWLITHDKCLDGATAALVGEASGLTPIFVEPDRVEAGLEQVTSNDSVYMADVSLKPEAWARWKERVTYVLDHHQSALPLASDPRVLLDQSRSGALLMYDYAVQEGWLPPSTEWLRLCRAVARYDLWLPWHEAGQDLNRMFHDLGYGWYRERFGNGWVPFTPDEADQLSRLVREEVRFVEEHLKTAVRYHKDLDFPIYGVLLQEEGSINVVSHTLIERGAALVLTLKPEKKLSARSDGRVDAAQLMEDLFHGGGHARAAGGRLQDDEPASLSEVLEKAAQYLARRHSALTS
jgi:oligoribonuclease NrnB/cAMP/cGMP phosphodiesterase (DHH superfamily)